MPALNTITLSILQTPPGADLVFLTITSSGQTVTAFLQKKDAITLVGFELLDKQLIEIVAA